MGRPQPDQAFWRLTRQQPLFRRLDAVIDSIAQQVRQRCLEFLQHVAVNLGFLALDFQPYLLAEAATQIADHAHLTTEHIGERTHATGQRSVVQHLCPLTGLPGELVQLGVLFHQQLLGLRQQAAGIFQ
ncbi:hypothetical protein D3C73_1120130 [compost metagenome]